GAPCERFSSASAIRAVLCLSRGAFREAPRRRGRGRRRGGAVVRGQAPHVRSPEAPDFGRGPWDFRTRRASLPALLDGHVLEVALADVLGPGPDQAVVGVLLEDVGR